METNNTTADENVGQEQDAATKGMLRLTPLSHTPTSWDEAPETKQKKGSRIRRISALVALGILSFFLFLYLTFPYGVLKEVLSMKITEGLQQSGFPIQVRIGSLKPHWFTGAQLGNVVVTNMTDKSAVLKLGEATARLNVLPLLIGRISVDTRITQAGGSLEANAVIPIGGLLKGAPNVRTVNVEFKSFALEPLFNHMLAIPRASKDPAMVLVQPILQKTTAGGALSGLVVFENTDKMHGTINLSLKNMFLLINDETLKIPQQNFSVAKIDLKYQNNTLTFGEATKLEAPDIGIGLKGNITFPEMPNSQAQANLDFKLSMHGQVEKSLGMIVPNLMRCRPLTNGVLEAKLQGPLTSMACQ